MESLCCCVGSASRRSFTFRDNFSLRFSYETSIHERKSHKDALESPSQRDRGAGRRTKITVASPTVIILHQQTWSSLFVFPLKKRQTWRSRVIARSLEQLRTLVNFPQRRIQLPPFSLSRLPRERKLRPFLFTTKRAQWAIRAPEKDVFLSSDTNTSH